MNKFDLIIIGAGPGGYETAAEARAMGLNVLLIERNHPGGTCLNCGCIPTKALCRSAQLAIDTASCTDAGIAIEGRKLSFARAIERKNAIVQSLRQGVMEVLEGVTYLHGEARFIDKSSVEVDGNTYSAPKIIIATGSAPASLPIPGAELAADSTSLLDAESLPESIIIIGGGVIGIEFASILAAFGVKVTVIEYCKEILPTMDADIAKRLRMSLKRRGIAFILGAAVTAIEPGFTVHYTAKGKDDSARAAQVLIAVGRRPVLPEGIDKLGIKLHRGAIAVDQFMLTSVEGIYAIGDVNGICMLAHAASAQGRVALGIKQSLAPVPAAVFTHPECASVGMTQQQCEEQGLDFIVGQSTFRSNGKALAMGEPDGAVKVIVERTTRKLLGCHICGPHAADLIAEPTLAISASLDVDTMIRTIHTHPTLGETLIGALRATVK